MKKCLSLWKYRWLETVSETSLHEKEDFYSHFNLEDIADAKIVCKDFEIKNVREYHHFYVQIDTLLSTDVFLSALGLTRQAALKRRK